MNNKFTPVNLSDEIVVQTLRYLNRNPKACFDKKTMNYSETKNYFKRNFDWSSKHFDVRLSRIRKVSEELYIPEVNKRKNRRMFT